MRYLSSQAKKNCHHINIEEIAYITTRDITM